MLAELVAHALGAHRLGVRRQQVIVLVAPLLISLCGASGPADTATGGLGIGHGEQARHSNLCIALHPGDDRIVATDFLRLDVDMHDLTADLGDGPEMGHHAARG